MNRRDKAITALQSFGPGFATTALVPAGASFMALNPAEQTSARFGSAIEQLEKRLQELEHTAAPQPGNVNGNGHGNGNADAHETAPTPLTMPRNAKEECAAHVALLLGKGQALLNLQQPDAALTCIEEALALDPSVAEAYVKKGTALEKLSRLDEAIDCYDQALTLDQSITMAYLFKGGVFNRLERYGEALQCYEKALGTKPRTKAS